jgi:hypothetical protein
MADARSSSLLRRLRELEEDDRSLADAIERVVDVAARADAVRARAGEIQALLAAMPGERLRLDEAEASARLREAEARRELAAATQRRDEAERSRRAGDEQKARAAREAAVAADAVAAVESQLERISEQRIALDEDATVLLAEGRGLAVAAESIAGEIGTIDGVSESGRGAPDGTLDGLDEWGARVRAALFVVRGSLEARRDRVVAEANSLAAAVLVELHAATSVADVRRRVGAALG